MTLAFLLACSPEYPPRGPPDLTRQLGPGEVRAGFVTDEAALFGGVAAEGRAGDVKIYNDRVRFVLQGMRHGDYYMSQGGAIVDADVVRPDGQPGRDLVDEFGTMVGLGRIPEPDRIEILSDGTDGTPALVRVVGHGSPMTLLTGTVESPDFVPDLDVTITTDQVLEPDSRLLRLVTTVEWHDVETALQVGDIVMMGIEVVDSYDPERGYDGDGETDGTWVGAVGIRNEGAVAILADEQPFPPSAIQTVLSSAGEMLAGFQPTITLSDGDTFVLSRYVGVGPDLATLTDEWYDRRGEATVELGGTVTAGGAAVAGARVHLVDAKGAPRTMAVTGEDGSWGARLPEGEWQAVATGRGPGVSCDLPEGAGWYAPFATAALQAEALRSLADGALPVPFAEGYGVSEAVAASASTDLTLSPPGFVSVDAGDERPTVVRIDFAAGDPVTADERIVPGRPKGAMAWAFLRDGRGIVPVEAGDYTLTAHRGYRWEAYTESLSVGVGETVTVDPTLSLSYSTPGVLVVDPHSHAAPSGDGELPMEDRLVTHAAHGVQVHFGTDHDRIADYRPVLEALGLGDWMGSVVADEVSPVLRGHLNVYPLEEVRGEPNNGALPWWELSLETPDLFAALREQVGAGIVQVNHPTSGSGMFSAAGYDLEAGEIESGDHWSEDFQAVEVLNSGHWSDFFPYYLDLVSRGLEPTPVGVSDAHGWWGGGESVTFLAAGVDEPRDLTSILLVTAMRAHGTVASMGPYIEATIDGDWAPGQTVTGRPDLRVRVLTPSWIPLDAVDLLRDGAVVETVAIESWTGSVRLDTTFSLDPALTGEDADAHYVVVARGSAPMAPVFPGTLPWAATAAIRVDVEGDGWTAPLPSLAVAE